MSTTGPQAPSPSPESAKVVVAERVGGPEVLRLVERQLPPPGPGKVALRVQAIGVNPIDLKIASGARGSLPEVPWQPGFEAAGVVTSVGPDVTAWRPGDDVIALPGRRHVRVGARRPGGGAHEEALVADRARILTIANAPAFLAAGAVAIGGGPGADPGTAIRDAARAPLAALAAAGELSVRIAKTFPLEQVADAWRFVGDGHAAGKIVLLPHL